MLIKFDENGGFNHLLYFELNTDTKVVGMLLVYTSSKLMFVHKCREVN